MTAVRSLRKSLWLFAVMIFLFFPGISSGGNLPKQPVSVTIGIYVVDLYDLDIKKGTYNADFWIWFKWKGDVDPRPFEIVNGYITSKNVESSTVVNGVNYVTYRCRAILHGRFNLSDYPWDSQKLFLMIEDDNSDTQKLIYVIDKEHSKIQQDLKVADRMTGDFKLGVIEYTYDTGFGNPTRGHQDKASYSRFIFEIPVRHTGSRVFVKTFLSLFISVAIAFLTFLIRPGDLPPRFSTGLSGLFGAVTSQVILYQALEECPLLTAADKIHYVALFFIFLSILESCISLKFYNAGKELIWKRMDISSMILFPLLFMVWVILLLP